MNIFCSKPGMPALPISAIFRQSEGLYCASFSRMTFAYLQKTILFEPVCLKSSSLLNPFICHTMLHLAFCLF